MRLLCWAANCFLVLEQPPPRQRLGLLCLAGAKHPHPVTIDHGPSIEGVDHPDRPADVVACGAIPFAVVGHDESLTEALAAIAYAVERGLGTPRHLYPRPDQHLSRGSWRVPLMRKLKHQRRLAAGQYHEQPHAVLWHAKVGAVLDVRRRLMPQRLNSLQPGRVELHPPRPANRSIAVGVGIPRGYSLPHVKNRGVEMLSYFQYKLKLREIAKQEEELAKRKPLNTQEAHDSGKIASYIDESNDLYEWRRLALTDYYRKVSDRIMVPMPPIEDKHMYEQVEWDKDPRQPRYLTDKGFTTIRNAVREEQKHRREVKAFWLTWVTGLGGILIGVISVLPKG